MRFNSQTSYDGVTEQLFTLDEIPGVLWTPVGAVGPRPLILMGHGGGQHKKAPGLVANALHFVTAGGFAVVAIDAPHHGDRPRGEEFARTAAENRAAMLAGEDVVPRIAALHTSLAEQSVPEWQTVLTAVLDHLGVGPVGYWGLSMGCGLGIPLIAAEPRIRAAVLGLAGAVGLADLATRITVPIQFLLQWDDRFVPRHQGLALFDAFTSPGKTLHANPGNHGDVPPLETLSALQFFQHHLA